MIGNQINVLYCVGPKGPEHTQRLLKNIEETTNKYIASSSFVKDNDEYEALPDKYIYDLIVV